MFMQTVPISVKILVVQQNIQHVCRIVTRNNNKNKKKKIDEKKKIDDQNVTELNLIQTSQLSEIVSEMMKVRMLQKHFLL